ncbi:NAD(P)/FAD-dependent oxidoreductase [Bauldia sp.]|uniref:NAD(P)/FAD-dependent oxidoreductase n=1 Tax=Bauldia sp. TaxID=2575872 RepID=UPI003BA85BB3
MRSARGSQVSGDPSNKSVAIVGGGYLGSELAKALEGSMQVSLIERADAFTHAPAMIRALVDPSLLDRALIPYDHLLTKGRVVKGHVTGIDGGGVTLSDGTRVAADYIVLATGSGNVAPFKSTTGDIAALRAANAEWHDALVAAKSVAIVGAGAVGTELAGEIASAMPGKKVTLISGDDALFPTLPQGLGTSLVKKLRAMGVEVIVGARAKALPDGNTPSGGSVALTSGREITADLIVPAVGARLSTGPIDQLPGVKHAPDGRIMTDAWMRPSSLPNVFAAGDVADNGDHMTIVGVSRQVPWLAKLLQSAAAGQSVESLKPYKPWGKAPILVPLGPERGSSFLMIATFGDWVTRIIKGRDLFLSKYQKIFGRKAKA